MFERLVGLEVTDEASYATYRENMLPILENYGGGFRYDFRVSEVLKCESNENINRLFIICFPDKESGEAFFANENYLKVRKEYFEPAVRSAAVISSYEKTV